MNENLKKSPRVSVGLPVYNGEKYVKEAIESVLAQTFEDFELIISDNASTDRTEEICREYTANDPRIHYYRNEKNLGAAKNFNRVFKLSSGEYFKWLAADDAMEPPFLERCVELLDTDGSIILACPRYTGYSEISGRVRPLDYDHDLNSPKAYQRVRQLLSNRRHGHVYPIWGLIRSSVLKETYLIRPFIGADECLVIEMALKGKFGAISDSLLRLKDHADAFHIIKHYHGWGEGAAEARWYNPENRGKVFLPYWRRLWEYLVLVIRSDEDLVSKLRILVSLHLLWPRWWKRLVLEVLFAIGLGKHYVRLKRAIVQRIRKQP